MSSRGALGLAGRRPALPVDAGFSSPLVTHRIVEIGREAYRTLTPHAGGKFVYRTEIVLFQLRIVIEDLLFGHARSEPTQHIPYRDPQPTNARLPRSFSWLNRDAR